MLGLFNLPDDIATLITSSSPSNRSSPLLKICCCLNNWQMHASNHFICFEMSCIFLLMTFSLFTGSSFTSCHQPQQRKSTQDVCSVASHEHKRYALQHRHNSWEIWSLNTMLQMKGKLGADSETRLPTRMHYLWPETLVRKHCYDLNTALLLFKPN